MKHSLRFLALLPLVVLLFVKVSAQIRFVQITDPHLFDEESEATNNKEALAASIVKINERANEGIHYEFVVVTGDIGIEKLVGQLVAKKESATGRKDAGIDKEIDDAIRKGVGVLSAILSTSKVRVWLFVPGNNDLYEENPATIEYYHRFIAQLGSTLSQYGIRVEDLCPADDSPSGGAYAKSAAFIHGPYAFIGFNNASFKNNDNSKFLVGNGSKTDPRSPTEVKRVQETYVDQVSKLLNAKKINDQDVSYVYLFYHIPDVDDPYLISGDQDKDTDLKKKLDERTKAVGNAISSPNLYSSWFVNQSVRDKWNALFKGNNDEFARLMGLFAGHLHDWKRETYQNYHWLKSAGSESLSKLYICPPIAVKRQGGQPDQARGFVEVSIDRKGRILDQWGRNGARIFWYNPVGKTYSIDEEEKEIEWLNQLALGRVYEETGRLNDAEGAYSKAVASRSAVTHQRALESLQRVAEKQVSPLNRYFFTPGGFSLSLEGISLLISTSLLIMLLTAWLVLATSEKPFKISFSAIYIIPLTMCFVVLMLALWLGTKWSDTVFSIPRSTASFLTVTFVLMCLWVLWATMKRRGKRVLRVIPLTDTTDAKLGATFHHIFIKTRQLIIISREDPFLGSDQPVTVVRLAEETKLGDLVEEVIPGWYGKLAAWFVRQATQPEFLVRGSLQSAGANLMMTVTLESAGQTLHTWFSRFPTADLSTLEEDFAYQVLVYTIAPELFRNAS
jgi:hypothetical protein